MKFEYEINPGELRDSMQIDWIVRVTRVTSELVTYKCLVEGRGDKEYELPPLDFIIKYPHVIKRERMQSLSNLRL